jgi:hypothetical protein
MQWYDLIVEIVTRNGDGELTKGDCPIRRHLKVIMVVDGDDEEEGAPVNPITCVELLNGEIFYLSNEGKIGTL